VTKEKGSVKILSLILRLYIYITVGDRD